MSPESALRLLRARLRPVVLASEVHDTKGKLHVIFARVALSGASQRPSCLCCVMAGTSHLRVNVADDSPGGFWTAHLVGCEGCRTELEALADAIDPEGAGYPVSESRSV